MPIYLTTADVKALSQDRPPWEPGDQLILVHPKHSRAYPLDEKGSLHKMGRLRYNGDAWMVSLEGSGAYSFYSGRFSLASSAKTRYKTNHKIGVPKGKLP